MKHEVTPTITSIHDHGFQIGRTHKSPHEPTRSTKEVAAMFADWYSSTTTLWAAVSAGRFPEPTLMVKSSAGFSAAGSCKKAYWKISVLEKELKRRRRGK